MSMRSSVHYKKKCPVADFLFFQFSIQRKQQQNSREAITLSSSKSCHRNRRFSMPGKELNWYSGFQFLLRFAWERHGKYQGLSMFQSVLLPWSSYARCYSYATFTERKQLKSAVFKSPTLFCLRKKSLTYVRICAELSAIWTYIYVFIFYMGLTCRRLWRLRSYFSIFQ